MMDTKRKEVRYVVPQIEIVEMEVERGFAQTQGTNNLNPTDWKPGNDGWFK